MARFITLILFILIVQGVGGGLAFLFPADQWHADLVKPVYNPPNYLFGIVWPILFTLIAIAGWRVFTSEGNTPGWSLWVLQMVLAWAWTPIFFGAHMIFWGMVVIGILVIVIVRFIAVTWPHDKLASLCMVPYAAWVSFAFALNAGIWWLN